MVLCRETGVGVESGFEPLVQLTKVLRDAPPGGRVSGVDSLDPEAGQPEEPMHLRHGLDQARPLGGRQVAEEGRGGLVRALIHLFDFPAPSGRELRLAYPLVSGSLAHTNQPLLLERLNQTGDIAGIETQALAEVAEVRSVGPDLVEQARSAERPAAAQEVIVERADPLGDEAVELPDPRDLVGLHHLTLVK